jgi:two-component sensor histidine kinase
VKYGALAADGGRVAVSWTLADEAHDSRRVALAWRETGGPAPDERAMRGAGQGFGTRMINLAVEQLGGTLDRQWPASGAVVQIEFPIT